jgi:hypothetical protein
MLQNTFERNQLLFMATCAFTCVYECLNERMAGYCGGGRCERYSDEASGLSVLVTPCSCVFAFLSPFFSLLLQESIAVLCYHCCLLFIPSYGLYHIHVQKTPFSPSRSKALMRTNSLVTK